MPRLAARRENGRSSASPGRADRTSSTRIVNRAKSSGGRRGGRVSESHRRTSVAVKMASCKEPTRGFRKLPYHITISRPPTLSSTLCHCPLCQGETLRSHLKKNETHSGARACRGLPVAVRFLKRTSRQPYLRSHIWIHSVVADSTCLAMPLL